MRCVNFQATGLGFESQIAAGDVSLEQLEEARPDFARAGGRACYKKRPHRAHSAPGIPGQDEPPAQGDRFFNTPGPFLTQHSLLATMGHRVAN